MNGTIESMRLTAKLDMLCRRARLGRADLAREVGGISKSTMHNWFNGVSRPDLETALKMARVLGVPLDFLADDSQDEPPISELTDDERTILTVVRAAKLDAPTAVAALWEAREKHDGRPLANVGPVLTGDAVPRAHGYWRGGEVQHQTDELKRQIREQGRAKRRPEPDIEIGTPLKGGPKPPQRKKGAG